MPGTWKTVSHEIAGVDVKQTPINEEWVATKKIEQLLQKGRSPKEIALIWNGTLGGSELPIVKKGKNRYGVAFDTLAYAVGVMRVYAKY